MVHKELIIRQLHMVPAALKSLDFNVLFCREIRQSVPMICKSDGDKYILRQPFETGKSNNGDCRAHEKSIVVKSQLSVQSILLEHHIEASQERYNQLDSVGQKYKYSYRPYTHFALCTYDTYRKSS